MRTEGALRLLSDYMKKGALDYPQKIALMFGDEKISYPELAERSRRLARYLVGQGIGVGDRIAYILTPRPEFFYLYMAASQIGAIIVGMSTRHTANEMEYILKNSEARFVFTLANQYDVDYQERMAQVLPGCSGVEKIFVIDGEPRLEMAVSFADVMTGDYLEFEDLVAKREDQVSTDDGLIIVYTSGSTGQPKGALMTHRNVIHTCLVEAAELEIGPDTVWVNHLPVNHVSGAIEAGAAAIVGGATQILEVFNPVRTLELVQKEKVTILGQVPTMYAMEFALPNYAEYDLSSLKTVVISGAPAPTELLNKILTTMSPNCRNCLGLTEVSGLITYTPRGADLETLARTVGKCAPEFEMKLVDKDRKPVPPGVPGEIAYRGTSVIKEYFRLPEATAAAIDEEGWFYSGDMGFINEEGNLCLVGRVKEMYITGGYNVYPAEIEEYITRYPGVMLAACVGVPDPIMGEIGRAYIVPMPGVKLEAEDIKNFLKDYLADYKIPRQFVFRDSLPMTLLGKIEKKLLAAEVKEEMAKC